MVSNLSANSESGLEPAFTKMQACRGSFQSLKECFVLTLIRITLFLRIERV